MTTAALRGRRSLAHLALIVALAALVFLTSGVAAWLSGFLRASTDAGLRTTLEATRAVDLSLAVSTRLSEDPPAQHDAVLAELADLFDGVPAEVHRSLFARPEPLAAAGVAGEDSVRGVLAAYEDIEQHASLETGAWPTGTGERLESAVHAEAAAVLGLDVGAVVSLGEGDEVLNVEVVGVWRPDDPAEAFWSGQPLATDGVEGSAHGPFIVPEPDLVANADRVDSRWQLIPTIDELRPADVDTLRSGIPAVQNRLDGNTVVDVGGVSVQTGLPEVLAELDLRLLAAQGVAAIPTVMFGVLAVVALTLAARLLAWLRLRETALLRARGASVTQLVGWSLTEALAVAVVPAALGAVAAGLLLRTAALS
ncbi:MAG: hypothetical protein ACRDWI_10245, partial [Jiangellaceae bacterium]